MLGKYYKALGQFFSEKCCQETDWLSQGRLIRAIETIDRDLADGSTLGRAVQNVGGEFSLYLSGLGYDGLITHEGGEGDIGNHESWVVFDPQKVDIVSEQSLEE